MGCVTLSRESDTRNESYAVPLLLVETKMKQSPGTKTEICNNSCVVSVLSVGTVSR